MNKKIRTAVTVICLSVLTVLAAGCSKITEDSVISVLDPYGPDNIDSAETDVYNSVLEQWQGANGQIKLDRKSIKGDYYDQELQFYGTSESELPDIFVLNENIVADWRREGLINEEEPLYIYEIPCKAFSVIVYDKDKWKSAGFEGFPDNWEEAVNADSNVIALNYQNDTTVRNIFLSPMTEIFCGEEWMDSVREKDRGNFFMTEEFCRALEETGRICDYCFSQREYEEKSGAVTSFLEGKCTAAVISTSDMYTIKEYLQKNNPERYEGLGFSFLPQKAGRNDDGTWMTTTVNERVLVINPKVAENSDKLAECINFCEYMTGENYSDTMASEFGFECQIPSSKEYEGTDEVWKQLSDMIKYRSDIPDFVECEDIGTVFGKSMYYHSDPELMKWASEGDLTTEEMANKFQDYYEMSGMH